MERKPLEKIRVVEMATMIAGPSCGRILAHLGAEVIKVESLEGEPYRGMTFYSNREPVIFDSLNAQKKSVSFNAKDPEVQEYLRRLLATADVFLSNIRADSLARLGLSYEAVSALNPKIIYAHFSGYGEKGDMAKLPGYDSTAFLTRDGVYRDFVAPDHEPVNHIPGFGDLTAGLALSTSILGALMNRSVTGKGEKIESALNQVGAWVMQMPMVYEQFGSKFQRRDGDPLDVGSANMQCRDGEWVYYSCGTMVQWAKFCRAIGREDLIADSRCGSLAAVMDNTPTLKGEIAEKFLLHDAEKWVKILRDNDVPCERHRHVREMADDEQLLVNGYIYRAQYPSGAVSVSAPPIQYGSVDLSFREKGEPLGAHTEEILQSLDCTPEEIRRLEEKGAVIG